MTARVPAYKDDCVEKLTELFDKNAPCYLPACTFNGRYQPTLGARRFVAFSAFSWVVDVLGLPAETTALEDIENAARWAEPCSTWQEAYPLVNIQKTMENHHV
jgi:hypothetical protein